MPPKRKKPATPPTKRRKRKPAAVEAPQPPAAPAVTPDDEDVGLGRVEIRRFIADRLSGEGLQPGESVSPARVVEAAAATFHISERQAFRYLAAVRESMAEVLKDDLPHQRARLILLQETVLSRAMSTGKLKEANGAIRNLMDLFGIKVQKHEVTTNDFKALIDAIRATPAQRLDEMAEFERLAAEAGIDPKELLGPSPPTEEPDRGGANPG